MALKDPPCVRPGTREVSIKRFTANDPGFRGKYNTRGGPFSPIDTIDKWSTRDSCLAIPTTRWTMSPSRNRRGILILRRVLYTLGVCREEEMFFSRYQSIIIFNFNWSKIEFLIRLLMRFIIFSKREFNSTRFVVSLKNIYYILYRRMIDILRKSWIVLDKVYSKNQIKIIILIKFSDKKD